MMPAARVLIRGDGIAALCCAHLLSAAGLSVAIERVARRPVPAILLSPSALALIRDVLGQPALFAGMPAIERRIVRWGGEATAVPHAAISIPETMLADALAVHCRSDGGAADFTVHAAPPLPSPSPSPSPKRFGARRGGAVAVRLRDPADASACWMEAVADGWLFLMPGAAGQAWLLGVGATIADLLAASRLIAPRIEPADGAAAPFDTCPRLALPLCGDGWLAAGTAAIAFDPICGDGAALAVRQAILASAVIVAIARGGDAPSLLAHYQAMLVAAMRRHLALCARFYATGGEGPWWRAELASLREGHDWCTSRLADAPAPAYELRGFGLVARAQAA